MQYTCTILSYIYVSLICNKSNKSIKRKNVIKHRTAKKKSKKKKKRNATVKLGGKNRKNQPVIAI